MRSDIVIDINRIRIHKRFEVLTLGLVSLQIDQGNGGIILSCFHVTRADSWNGGQRYNITLFGIIQGLIFFFLFQVFIMALFGSFDGLHMSEQMVGIKMCISGSCSGQLLRTLLSSRLVGDQCLRQQILDSISISLLISSHGRCSGHNGLFGN